MNSQGELLANKSCSNHAAAVASFVARHGRAVQAGVEASTGTAHLVDELSTHFGWSIHQCHPGYVRRMKQNPDKTDWADAKLLADLVRVGYLPKVWLAPERIRQLRMLVRYRQQLVDSRRNAKLRISALLRQNRVRVPHTKWTKVWRNWIANCDQLGEQGCWLAQQHLAEIDRLNGQIHAVELRLRRLTESDPMVLRLLEQPGVGWVTAWVLRAEIGRFDRFQTGKQLARYCGVTPRNASSGNRQADAGLIKAGNPQVRAILIETAHRLTRHDIRWANLKTSMRAAGKPVCLIAAAIANRWVRWLYHQMCDSKLNEAA
jgi:transposase